MLRPDDGIVPGDGALASMARAMMPRQCLNDAGMPDYLFI
jgi:hypothetical protein